MKKTKLNYLLLISFILGGCNFGFINSVNNSSNKHSNSSSSSHFDPWDNLSGGGIASTGVIEDRPLDDYVPGEDIVVDEDQLTTDDTNATNINLEDLDVLPSGVSYSESILTISSGGIYSLSGEFRGSIVVEKCDDNTVQILLNNVKIQTKEDSLLPAILFKKTDGLRILTVKENTYNSLQDSSSNYGDDAEEAIIASKKSSLTINGKGVLQLISKGANTTGIKVKKELTIIDTNIVIAANNNGIKADDLVYISYANISIEAKNDGIKTDKEAETVEEATEFASDRKYGYIYIENSSININCQDDGICANNALYINNLESYVITITTNGGAPKTITESSSDNANGKALKVDGITYVDENGNETEYKASYEENYSLVITGGTYKINSNDDSISSKGNLMIMGGDFEITSGDDGIHAEYLTSIYGGNINIRNSYEGIEGAGVEIFDGNINLKALDDGINAANGDLKNYDYHIYVGGGNIIVDAEGDGVDSNGWMKMEAGTLIIHGPTKGGNGSLDSDKGILVTGGNLIAFGSSGMVENPGSNSTQCYVSINLSSALNADTQVIVFDSNGNDNLLEINSQKKFQSLIISLEAFEMSASYIIHVGSQQYNATLTKIGTALGTNSNGGGNQGGGRPPRPY